MISVTVAGNLGADAQVGEAGDTPVVNFSIASNTKVKGEDVTTWVRCSFFGARAEAVSQYLTKGKSVVVRGSLSTREYEKDGETRYSLECRCDDVQLFGGKKEDSAPAPKGKPGKPGKK